MGERLSELVSGIRGIPRLIGVNLLCFVVCLPLLSWFYLVFNTYINAGLGGEMVDFLPGIGYFAGLLLRLPPVLFYGLFLLSAALAGPFLLGLHFMAGRLIQKDEIVFSDFLTQTKKHLLRGFFLGLFSTVLIHFLLWNMFFGMTGANPWISFALIASRWVSIGVLALLFLILPFVCQMLAFTQLSLWAALKNAMILARVYLGRGLFALFCILLYWWLTIMAFPMAALLALPLLSFSLTALLQTAVCWPLIEKHVLHDT